MAGNVIFSGPMNPPGTDPEHQRCEFCAISLGGSDWKFRSKISKDPDYTDAGLCIYCDKCRKTKLGRIPDSEYLDLRKKWRRIVYQMFYRAQNVEGFWRFVEELRPFGDNIYDPRTSQCEEPKTR